MMLQSKLMPILSIVGPTASGKTNLAINLAQKLNGEIISADSMQIYKEFNVATAKPELSQLKLVKHHLIDVVSAEDDFSVAEFVDLSKSALKDILNRGKLPILVGGTGLYVDFFLNNLQFETVKCSEVLPEYLHDKSNEELYDILKSIDPMSAKKIHINDTKRVVRAISFFYNYGYTISEQTQNSKNRPKIYNTLKIGLTFKNRELLYERINSRVDQMLQNGLIDEAQRVSKLHLSKTAEGAIGYKEIENYLNGEQSLDQAVEKLKQSTRRYAKRQLTWFRKDKEINWIYVDEFENFDGVLNYAQNIIKNWNYKI